ncbi:MAG: tetraacyldisaccharide 4'-kinase [Bdellovibrionales bacterium]|nr:tetraacyldisaccharide 4'-kinase [Bdellovibrionales bacterium]
MSVLTPLAEIYKGIASTRNALYDRNVLKIEKLNVPVVSVGNLTMGGTGKTPAVLFLVDLLLKNGKSVGVISRGYGRKTSGVLEVEAAFDTNLFGDEPALIKKHFPNISVFVGEKRVEAGRALLKKNKVDVIIADDAFQHRRLYRNLDIVLLDATESLLNYEVFPQGRAREPKKGLERADIVLITKANLEGALLKDEIIRFFNNDLNTEIKQDTFISEMVLGKAYFLFSDKEVIFQPGEKVTLVSAVGNPDSFEKLCKKEYKVDIQQHLKFSDHYRFLKNDFLSLESFSGKIIVTEKDAIKLRSLNLAHLEIVVAPLKMKIPDQFEVFSEKIIGLCS